MASTTQFQLDLAGLTKSFGGTRALYQASLAVQPGEIHALLGMNGSGKSTLIKVLAGFHKPDSTGSPKIEVRGQALTVGDPGASRAAGLRFIHQDLGLIDTLSVEANFSLASPRRSWWTSPRRDERRVQRILDRYGLKVDAGTLAGKLGPTQRAIVAIIRAVEDDIGKDGVLVLDEPTAALPSDEVEHLFQILRMLKGNGVSIIYVSHRLPEILEIADRFTVLREGQTVASGNVSDYSLDALIETVLGYREAERGSAESFARAETVFEVHDLCGGAARDIHLEVNSGEIVGLTGVLGSGYEDVLALAFGAKTPSSGRVRVAGKDITALDPAGRIAIGMVYCPADRKRLGSFGQWTLRENVTAPLLPVSRPLGRISRKAEVADVMSWLPKFDVVPADSEAIFSTLSGGNQQKVVLTRWMRTAPQVLLLDEPTMGVDASAKRTIRQAMHRMASDGVAIVLASSDVEELVQVCDRVLVCGDGSVQQTVSGADLNDQNLNRAVMFVSRRSGLRSDSTTR